MRYTVSYTRGKEMRFFSFEALPPAMTFACTCLRGGRRDASVVDEQGHCIDAKAIDAYCSGEIKLSKLRAPT